MSERHTCVCVHILLLNRCGRRWSPIAPRSSACTRARAKPRRSSRRATSLNSCNAAGKLRSQCSPSLERSVYRLYSMRCSALLGKMYVSERRVAAYDCEWVFLQLDVFFRLLEPISLFGLVGRLCLQLGCFSLGELMLLQMSAPPFSDSMSCRVETDTRLCDDATRCLRTVVAARAIRASHDRVAFISSCLLRIYLASLIVTKPFLLFSTGL